MKVVPYVFAYKGEMYTVEFIIESKRMRSIRFEVHDNHIIAKADKYCTREYLISVIEKHKLGLVNMFKRNMKQTDEFIYIFGDKHLIKVENGIYTIEGIGSYRNEEEKEKLLKRILNRYIDQRFPYFEDLMHVKKGKYKYHIRKAKTRYGSNSSYSNTILFSLDLVHFSYEIIDSVIIHEFAHDFQRNHSSKFYDIVYQYCPHYDELRAKMVKGLFK